MKAQNLFTKWDSQVAVLKKLGKRDWVTQRKAPKLQWQKIEILSAGAVVENIVQN